MRRLLACILFALTPLGAQANTDLAQQWGVEATRLSEQTMTMIHALDMGQSTEVSERFTLDVYRFGRTSADLAHWIDQSDGPSDLGCIFRGMAKESEAQLTSLETDFDILAQRDSLMRLAGMFADAEIISIAAQRRSPTTGRVAATLKDSCIAEPQRISANRWF